VLVSFSLEGLSLRCGEAVTPESTVIPFVSINTAEGLQERTAQYMHLLIHLVILSLFALVLVPLIFLTLSLMMALKSHPSQ